MEKITMLQKELSRSYPDPLKIPKKNPTLVYRWVRNTPESISMAEAKGYEVANSDTVRAAGLKPSADGSARYGDLILMVEPASHHSEHQKIKEELRKKRREAMRHGVRRERGMRVPGTSVTETIKEE